MSLRKLSTGAAATLLATILTACGSPNDVPTAGALSNRTVTATASEIVNATLPTPTLVPTDTSTTATPEASTTPATTTPEASTTPTASASPNASAEAESGNPVAAVIANEFGVSVTEVEAYHDQGIGYGVLAQFYAIANNRCGAQASYTVNQLIALKQGGLGMGEIRKQALGTASANECSLGRIKQGDLDDADRQDAGTSQPNDDKGGTSAANDDQGTPHDKGKSDDKGKPTNPGNGDGKGNGGGNGGNSGGSGKGNGGNGGGGGKGNGGGKGKGK